MESANTIDETTGQFREIDAKPAGFRWGAIGGVAVVLYGLIRYVLDIELYISWGWSMASYLFVIAVMIIAPWEVKNKQSNYISFKKALQASFGAAVVSLVIASLFAYVMASFVDPNINKYTKAKSMEFTEKMLEASGASKEKIEEELERIEKTDFDQSIGQFMMGVAGQFIVGFLYALVISGVFHLALKDNKPLPPAVEAEKERVG